MDYYIASRLTSNKIRKVLGRDNVSHLNQRAASDLRKVANKLGIKQVQKGARLEFYIVTDDEYKTLTYEGTSTLMALQDINWHPLMSIKMADLRQIYEEVNAKYPSRMKTETFKMYQAEIQALLEKKVVNSTKTKKPSEKKMK